MIPGGSTHDNATVNSAQERVPCVYLLASINLLCNDIPKTPAQSFSLASVQPALISLH